MARTAAEVVHFEMSEAVREALAEVERLRIENEALRRELDLADATVDSLRRSK